MSSRLPRLLLLSTVACLAAAVVLRPLWYDEILGHWMATLPWPDGVREATRAGVDLQPPGWYLLVRWTEHLTGAPSGPRWLSLVGVLGAAFLVGRMARERWGPELGLLAAVTVFLTGAREYAWEGRPYGLLLGTSALSLYAWSRAARGVRRSLWIPVLGVTLAASIQLHYFAVALWFPLAVGEIVRARAGRRIDVPMLAVLGLPLLQIPAILPDARAAGELMRIGPFKSPGAHALEGQYRALLSFLVSVPPALVLLLVFRDGLGRSLGSLRRALSDPDVAVILALLLLPAVAMAIAVVGGSGLSHQRYALGFTLGASLSVAGLAHALKPAPEACRRAVLVGCLAVLFLAARDARRQGLHTVEAREAPVARAPDDLKLVYPGCTQALELWQSADEQARGRMILVAEPAMAVAAGMKATVDVNLSGARRFFPFPVATWREVRAFDGPFVLLQPIGTRTWLLPAVLHEGARLERVPAAQGWEAWIARFESAADRDGRRPGTRAAGESDPERRTGGEDADVDDG